MSGRIGLYYAAVALARIRTAQQICEEHVTSAWTGRCLACEQPGPCPTRLDADDTLDRYQRLPQRRPGASLSGFDDWPHVSGHFDWFGDPAGDHA